MRVIVVAAFLFGLFPVAAALGGSKSPSEPGVHSCIEYFNGRKSIPPVPKAAVKTACKWKQSVLTVKFLDGEKSVQDRVEKIAREWTRHCGLRFEFVSSGKADIRISFDMSSGFSWSYVGTCREGVGENEATMNFGWLTPDSPEKEYRRVVLHEFGHALGMIHEHQSPAVAIDWNKEAVYERYARQGWDRRMTDGNIFGKYGEEETNYTAYDPRSIMQYPVPRELLNSGREIGWNTELSEVDKAFIGRMYP